MTPREANADLLAEITALRAPELQGALVQAGHPEGATSEILRLRQLGVLPASGRRGSECLLERAGSPRPAETMPRCYRPASPFLTDDALCTTL
jgi:hypothetical protein